MQWSTYYSGNFQNYKGYRVYGYAAHTECGNYKLNPLLVNGLLRYQVVFENVKGMRTGGLNQQIGLCTLREAKSLCKAHLEQSLSVR